MAFWKSVRITYVFFVAASLFSCKSPAPKTSTENTAPIADTVKARTDAPLKDSIEFVPEEKDGFVLPDTLKIFNKDLSYNSIIVVTKLERIKILTATKKKYFLPNDSDECFKANFLEILYKGKQYVVSGKYIYKIQGQRPVHMVTVYASDYEIYASVNYAVGAKDEVGLTGCDEFSLLTIRKVSDDIYSLIENPADNKGKYSVLTHDDGSHEKIERIRVIADTIVFDISAQYQAATGSYCLKVVFKPNLCPAIMTDRIVHDGTQTERLPDLR